MSVQHVTYNQRAIFCSFYNHKPIGQQCRVHESSLQAGGGFRRTAMPYGIKIKCFQHQYRPLVIRYCHATAVFGLIFSERELKFMFAICHRPSVCLSVCRLSVTFVRPTQAIEIFGNIFTPFGTLAIYDLCIKILRRTSQGNPSGGGLNRRRVVEYSDFGPIDSYISETVQDRREVTINH